MVNLIPVLTLIAPPAAVATAGRTRWMRWVGPQVDEVSGGGNNIRVPTLIGVHHVSVPTSDPLAASDWYVRVFGFATLLIEEHESDVVAVLLQHPCGARLLLRRAPFGSAAARAHISHWLFELGANRPDQLGFAFDRRSQWPLIACQPVSRFAAGRARARCQAARNS